MPVDESSPGKDLRGCPTRLPTNVVQALQEWLGHLERVSRELRKTQQEYNRMRRAGSDTDPFRLAAWLRGRTETLELGGPLAEEVRHLAARLDELARDLALRLDADLREAVAGKGWRIDGQWPKYYVERVVRLDILEVRGRVEVGDTVLPTLHVPAIISALEGQVHDLLPQDFDAREFLHNLASAYSRLSSPEQRAVPIWQLYREIVSAYQPRGFWRDAQSRSFRPFGEQRFRACLSGLLEQDHIETNDGFQMRLLPPIRAEEGIYMYVPAERRFSFIGRIEFLPVPKPGAS